MINKYTNVSRLFNRLCSYSRREYRSVEINVSPLSSHTVGMQPISTDAFLRNAGDYEPLFSTERYIPSECFAANKNVNSIIYK